MSQRLKLSGASSREVTLTKYARSIDTH